MLWGKRRDSCKIVASINLQLTELRMQKPHDDSKASPAAFMQDNTLIAVIELGLSNWLVAGLIPGVSREPLKKLRSEEHTSELQSRQYLVCRLLLEKKN